MTTIHQFLGHHLRMAAMQQSSWAPCVMLNTTGWRMVELCQVRGDAQTLCAQTEAFPETAGEAGNERMVQWSMYGVRVSVLVVD